MENEDIIQKLAEVKNKEELIKDVRKKLKKEKEELIKIKKDLMDKVRATIGFGKKKKKEAVKQ